MNKCPFCNGLLDTGFNCTQCGAKFRYDFDTKTLIQVVCGDWKKIQNNAAKSK